MNNESRKKALSMLIIDLGDEVKERLPDKIKKNEEEEETPKDEFADRISKLRGN